MIFRARTLTSLYIALTLIFSVYMCAYTSTVSMDAMDMDGSSPFTQHIDHAHVLTSALVPLLTFLIISLSVLILLYRSATLNTSPTLLYTLIDSSPPPERTPRRYFHNPRSPPVA